MANKREEAAADRAEFTAEEDRRRDAYATLLVTARAVLRNFRTLRLAFAAGAPDIAEVREAFGHATRVNEALAATGNARKPRAIKEADKQLGEAIAGLRAAVVEYTSRKRGHRHLRPLPAAESRVIGDGA